MMLSIKLYSTNESLVSKDIVRSCLGLLDVHDLKVSRTLGPGNYYEINKRSLNGENVILPPNDINYQDYTDAEAICGLLRRGSVLTISYWGSKSERVGEIVRAISRYSRETSVFFSSTTDFSFGPLDLFDLFEDEEGQDDVRLVDVAQFCFSISSDNYLGDLDALRKSLEVVEPFVRFRSDLERIVGPLTLRVEV